MIVQAKPDTESSETKRFRFRKILTHEFRVWTGGKDHRNRAGRWGYCSHPHRFTVSRLRRSSFLEERDHRDDFRRNILLMPHAQHVIHRRNKRGGGTHNRNLLRQPASAMCPLSFGGINTGAHQSTHFID